MRAVASEPQGLLVVEQILWQASEIATASAVVCCSSMPAAANEIRDYY